MLGTVTRVLDTDDGLLERARAGEPGALDALLERHQHQVYRFGLRMCRDPEDARDVLQDTLFAAARGVRDFRGASSLSTWLFTIARSFCIKKRRRSKFAPRYEGSLDRDLGLEASEVPDTAKSPHELVAGKEVEQALERAIAELPPGHREVLLLRDAEGLTAPEVAEVLHISVQAVKSRLHRARLQVREMVAPMLGVTAHPAARGDAATCPDVVAVLSRHLEGEIDPAACSEMERHVASCGRCRGACDSLKRTLALCRARADATAVPREVQSDVRRALRALLREG